MSHYWPIVLIVGANTIYHVASKGTSEHVNAFLSLTVTYLIAALTCLVIYFITNPAKNIFSEIAEMNWATIVLGIAIVGLEIGSISMYRAGWNISIGSLVANIALAVVLITIGLLFYKDHISTQQIIGVILCIGGLILINK